MTTHCYLFEAKSVQTYLFRTGRLRDVVSGSELIEGLTGELLDRAVAALSSESGPELQFSRRAGGSLYAFAQGGDGFALIEEFARLWSLLVQQYAPGLPFDHAIGSGEAPLTAFQAARARLLEDASRITPLRPLAPPPVARSPRTGLPVVDVDHKDRDGIDAPTERARACSGPGNDRLIKRVDPWAEERQWPMDLQPGSSKSFPFRGEDHTVALVHADGNGLGQILMAAQAAARQRPDSFIPMFRALSDGIGQSTERAVHEAVAATLRPEQAQNGLLPARPIVVGGDDVTFIVRADLALAFTRTFLAAFESLTPEWLSELARDHYVADLPDRMTASAGIVYMGANQPFHMAVGLAEGVTRAAKDAGTSAASRSAPAPATVAFHRVGSAMIDTFDAAIEREHTIRATDGVYMDTLGAYALERDAGLPALDDLEELAALQAHPRMARGPARQILTLLATDPYQACRVYTRWRSTLAQDAEGKRLRAEFDACLSRLLRGESDGELPFAAGEDARGVRASPLGDALTLNAVGDSHKVQDTAEEATA